MKVKNKKQFVFWRYSLFPYILGAEFKKIVTDDGWVEVKGNKGSCIKPLAMFPLEKGLKIQKQLKELEERRLESLQFYDKILKETFSYLFKKY